MNGEFSEVSFGRIIIAGPDRAAVDAHTATLFGRRPEEIGHIR